MSALTEGKLSVVLHLGTIEKSSTGPTRVVGQQLYMEGLSGLVYVSPEVAAQWIPILQQIADSNK